MGYWKAKVLPKLKKVFEINNTKKLVATEACKSFDDSKEEITKEFDEKKADLTPQVIEIYEASTVEIKALIKDPKEAGLKKHSAAVQTLLEKLVEIDFPGSKAVCEASSKVGPALIPGPVFFVFEKVSTFIVVEEKAPEEPTVAPVAESEAAAATATAEEPIVTKDKEIVIEPPMEKKEGDVVAAPEPAATPTPEPPTKAEEPETTPPPKVEEPEATPQPKVEEPTVIPPPNVEESTTPPPKAEEPTTMPSKA